MTKADAEIFLVLFAPVPLAFAVGIGAYKAIAWSKKKVLTQIRRPNTKSSSQKKHGL